MDNKVPFLTLLILVSVISLPSGAQEDDETSDGGVEESISMPGFNLNDALVRDGAANNEKFTLGDSGISAELSAGEIEYIEQKKFQLIKYLIEQQELEGIRDYIKESSKQDAIENSMESEFPLTNDEIKIFRIMQHERARAENSPISENISLDIRTQSYSISSSDPIELHVMQGYASSLVLFDSTGQPWPLVGDVVGDSAAFRPRNISSTNNTIVFEVLKPFSESNALITIAGESTPIVIKLIDNGKNVDTRLSVRIPKPGPNATIKPFQTKDYSDDDPALMTVLNGDIGSLGSYQVFDVAGADAEAILYQGWLYLRTEHLLASPAWINYSTSPTGVHAYKLKPVSELLLSVNGELTNTSLSKPYLPVIKKNPSIFN